MGIFSRPRTIIADQYANVADGVVAASVRTGKRGFLNSGKEDPGIKKALADVMGQLGKQTWRRGEQKPDKLNPVVRKYPDGVVVVEVAGPNNQVFYSPVRAPSGWQHPTISSSGYQPAFRGVKIGEVIGGAGFKFGDSGLDVDYKAYADKYSGLAGVSGDAPNPTLVQGNNGQLYMVDDPNNPNVSYPVSMTGNEKETFRGVNLASVAGTGSNMQAITNSQKILANTFGRIGKVESKTASYGLAAGAGVTGVMLGKSGLSDFKKDPETGRSHKVKGALKLAGAVLLEAGAAAAIQHGTKIGTGEQSWAQNMQNRGNQPSSGRTTP